jgi:protein-S-isoprenylcysteine O-methyltransferase Ste14
VWALKAMGAGSFSIMPEPNKLATLTRSGPYQVVRHPMYLAVILACAGICIQDSHWFNWLCFLLLIIVLAFKIKREEILLIKKYEQYDDYRKNSKALIPFIF